MACGLLADEFVEVFCEHHEDTLIKLDQQHFAGVQVKTRQLGTQPWKASDEEMLAAITKFVANDCEFPGRFARFTIATNHQFFRTRPNGANLPHLLELAKHHRDDDPLPAPLATFVKRIAARAERSEEAVLRTLKKTTCDDALPKLSDAMRALCDHLAKHHPLCAEASYPVLTRAAEHLAAEVSRAATLHHEQHLPVYLSLQPTSSDRLTTERVDGKRLTPDRIKKILDDFIQSPPDLLAPAEASALLGVPALNSRLAKKLTAGGLSAITVDSARDCWASALKQQLDWNSKLGEERALQRHQHLQTLVRAEAASSYEATRSLNPQGASMLEDLRKRLRARRSAAPSDVFGSIDEQLLGRAYMLTEECKVWWSAPFDIGNSED